MGVLLLECRWLVGRLFSGTMFPAVRLAALYSEDFCNCERQEVLVVRLAVPAFALCFSFVCCSLPLSLSHSVRVCPVSLFVGGIGGDFREHIQKTFKLSWLACRSLVPTSSALITRWM